MASKPPGRPVFGPLTRTADMIRADLAAAGVEYETASGVIDFYALRGCYISAVVSSGASVKTAQTLARHATPVLTIGVYARASLHDIAGAVDALPDLSPPDGPPRGDGRDGDGRCDPIAYSAGAAREGRNVSEPVGSTDPTWNPSDDHNSLVLSGFGGNRRGEAGMGRPGIEPGTPGFSVLCSTS